MISFFLFFLQEVPERPFLLWDTKFIYSLQRWEKKENYDFCDTGDAKHRQNPIITIAKVESK